ncbi:interleukin-13 receptor subunit alpha-2 isoform X2 [Genypterus blacodes]|uniref:interleukin-13 receptor subunit alpha-2 isoform X2 n=1 Tax=Genypterus blacodes TaxID=154954 RepID=UPI003F774D4D
MMERTNWHIYRASLMLLILCWTQSRQCNGLTVDPPEDLTIIDPGHLGLLKIQWRPPTSLSNIIDCQKMFRVEYFSTDENAWNAIQTVKMSYIAQFDLTKDIRVRVYTLLRGPCTNGSVVKSATYTERVQKPASTGLVGTTVQDFTCIFHMMEYVLCTWKPSLKQPANSHHNLFFWHAELEQTEECPKYIISHGFRRGCNFTGKYLPDFTDINICVNGSSAEGPLKPTFISLQIQNLVKPATTKALHLHAGPDRQQVLHWERPAGRVPVHCLEWEVEHDQEGSDGKQLLQQYFTKQMSLTELSIQGTERNCFRARSKLQKYCANDGFWSDWSQWTCYPANKGSNKTQLAKHKGKQVDLCVNKWIMRKWGTGM